MTLIESASGVIQRFQGGIEVWPGRTQREVHPARRDEAISYRWDIDPNKMQPRQDESGWEHYTYRFTYRYLGRTLSITWRCGTAYGTPKPWDGLDSAFRDAATVAYEAFTPSWADDFGYDSDDPAQLRKAQRIYDACEAMEHRIAEFFGGDTMERERWETLMNQIDNDEATVTTYERRAA